MQRIESLLCGYGQEHLIEEAVARFHLTEMRPETVLITGEPETGAGRLLACIARYVEGEWPATEVYCRSSDQSVSCRLLVAIISRFFTHYTPSSLGQLLRPACGKYPWLPALFPVLRGGHASPPLPEDHQSVRQGLTAVLHVLASTGVLVAIVHDLQAADRDSLEVLASMQAMSGHGLRLLASTGCPAQALTDSMPLLAVPSTSLLEFPPLTREQVAAYLGELLPDVANPDVADALFSSSHGMPLSIEAVLRFWISDGVLQYDGSHWSADLGRLRAQAGEDSDLFHRLACVVLTGSTTVDFLREVWQTTADDAVATVLQGRALGYLLPLDPAQPDRVECADSDESPGLLQYLTAEERAGIHARIAEILESRHGRNNQRYSPDLAYHLAGAGEGNRAELYLNLVQLALPVLLGLAVSPAAIEPVGPEILPPLPVQPADQGAIFDAALAIRLAGVRYRLYPAEGAMAQEGLQQAVAALEHLFESRPSLTIRLDGTMVTFDGAVSKRPADRVAVKDYQTWMMDANLETLQLQAGLEPQELERLLVLLATHEPNDELALEEKLQQESYSRIRLQFQGAMAATQARGGYPGGGWPYPPSGPAPATPGMRGFAPGMGPVTEQKNTNGAAPPAQPDTPTANVDNRPERSSAKSTSQSAAELLANLQDLRKKDQAPRPPAIQKLDRPDTLTPEAWKLLPETLSHAAVAVRRTMMSDLARWLAKEEQFDNTELYEHIDSLLSDRLSHEDDPQALQQTDAAILERLHQLMKQGNVRGCVAVLEAVSRRLGDDASPAVVESLTSLLNSVVVDEGLQALFLTALTRVDQLDALVHLVGVLGPTGNPLYLSTIKSVTEPHMRDTLIQVLSGVGEQLQPSLEQELGNANPSAVDCQLLDVLAGIGSRGALGAISKKLEHPEVLVRLAALSAAVKIAREHATPYLQHGLKDESAIVRAHAASLVGACLNPSLLPVLASLLQTGGLGRREPEEVQLATCLALGQFSQAAAREALMQTLQVRFFTLLHRKSDKVRSAAVTALAGHLASGDVQRAVQQAMQDHSDLVRQTAERVWQQYQEGQGRG